MQKSNAEAWTKANVEGDLPKDFIAPAWPHEILVKTFSSRSHSKISARFRDLAHAKVLDVGCLWGNNLRLFSERGHECVGVEATPDMVDLAKKNLGRTAKVFEGTNRSLPFSDNEFDLLTSLNTIHYDSGPNVRDAFIEFRRVLKPGGIAFIETAGTSHMIRAGAERLGPLEYRNPSFGDFRSGTFGLFDSKEHFKSELQAVFSEVEVGYALEEYPERTVDFFFGLVAK